MLCMECAVASSPTLGHTRAPTNQQEVLEVTYTIWYWRCFPCTQTCNTRKCIAPLLLGSHPPLC